MVPASLLYRPQPYEEVSRITLDSYGDCVSSDLSATIGPRATGLFRKSWSSNFSYMLRKGPLIGAFLVSGYRVTMLP